MISLPFSSASQPLPGFASTPPTSAKKSWNLNVAALVVQCISSLFTFSAWGSLLIQMMIVVEKREWTSLLAGVENVNEIHPGQPSAHLLLNSSQRPSDFTRHTPKGPTMVLTVASPAYACLFEPGFAAFGVSERLPGSSQRFYLPVLRSVSSIGNLWLFYSTNPPLALNT